MIKYKLKGYGGFKYQVERLDMMEGKDLWAGAGSRKRVQSKPVERAAKRRVARTAGVSKRDGELTCAGVAA